ncbi:hypothetical protein [Allokutzneria sp. NRRL B-24872]|uniref:hypothetical protein n=1 Tax=Allokutzneria sp. NRRL B-24872 TaxID=1137961 RepID=UPI000A3B1499|nr:hypothetical protein [Allokutzneria sp. NRRL B-24872]
MSLVDVRSWTPAARSVAEAARRFLIDVCATHGSLPVTAIVADHGDSGVRIRLRFGGGEVEGSVSARGDDEDVCTEVAERLQSVVVDHLPGWPECPGHGHQAVSTRLDGGAVWLCPTEGATRFAVSVGHYPRPDVNVAS